jgi:formate--tetrahydrofolate ligase
VRRFGVQPVVAINHFPTDHASELAALEGVCAEMGVRHAVCEPYTGGGAGVADLARQVEEACDEGSEFQLLYPDEASLKDKIEAIATEVYGADGVSYDLAAERNLSRFEDLGWGSLPICMAKTHLSISHDPSSYGAPRGWTLPIRDVRAAVGAGFVLPLCGDIRTMPGLGSQPAAVSIDIDEHGNVVGLA